MADEVPIIIGSDDESDSDDVVLIKEEIEVDDGDDVIFLSETKASPQPPTTEHHLKPHPPDLPLRSLSLPAAGGGSDTVATAQDTVSVPVIHRSISISSCAGRLSLDDTDSADQGLAQCDSTTLPLLGGNMVNANSGPLDLSSKSSDTTLQPPAMCGGCNAPVGAMNITGSGGITQGTPTADPTSLSLSTIWQNSNGSVTIDTRSTNFTSSVGDARKSPLCSGASFQACSVSGSTGVGVISNSQTVADDTRIHAPMLSMSESRVHAPVLSLGSYTDVAGLSNNSVSVSMGSYSDMTVLPGGFMASTAMLPQFPHHTSNTTAPVCDTRLTDLNATTYYSFPMSNGATLFTNTQVQEKTVQEKTNSIAPVPTNPFGAKDQVSFSEPMDTSDQKLTVTKPTLCTDKQSENVASSSAQNTSPNVVGSIATSLDNARSILTSMAVLATSLDSTSATISAPMVVSASGEVTVAVAPSTSSEATPRSDSTPQVSSSTQTTSTISSLSSDNMPCSNTSTQASLSVPTLSSSSSTNVLPTPVSSCTADAESTAASTSTAPVSSSASCATSSSSSSCDAMSTSHISTTSTPSPWQTTTSTWSDRKSPFTGSDVVGLVITDVITSPTTSLPASTCTSTCSDSIVSQSVSAGSGLPGALSQSVSAVSGLPGAVNQSTSGMTGLPGGSTSFLPVQQSSTTSTTSGLGAGLSQSQAYSSTSSNTFNLSDSSRLYNPLTLPIYMQNQHLKHSLSLSALSNRPHSSTPMYKRQFSFPRTTPLPPKKQKRNYSDGVSKCANCAVTLIGEKFSRCPNGHTACAKCLEEKVKLLLTGKARESVRCLDRLCDSFYPVSELKLSLPSMVVEILEDKLDQEYVDYISDMILKNASGDTDQPGSSRDTDRSGDGGAEKERFQELKCDGIYPSNWTSMDENAIQKKGYMLVQLDVDTPEYEEVVLQFFQSMIDQNVEVTSVHRVQNPIQWKYYCVKKCEIEQDNEGFALERQLFHGTSSTVVDAICRRGFDWRVCGKHGTLYGQGSYFAVNASYSHQYTDLKTPRHLGSSMMLANPMSMTLPTTPSLIYPPVNINFGQPLNTLTFTALNLSHTATPPTTNTSTGSAFQAVPSPSVQGTGSGSSGIGGSSQTGLLLGQQTGLSATPGGTTPIQGSSSGSSSQRPPMGMRFKVVPKQPAIRTLLGHPSSGLMTGDVPDMTTRTTAKVFLGRVLVGKFVKGHAKLRKPPPLYPRQDPFGKCFDSCVDEPRNPKIFVIFDSAQAYPEYLLEYTFTSSE